MPSYGNYYALDIHVDPAKHTLRGCAALTLAAKGRTLDLFLAHTLTVDSAIVDGSLVAVSRLGDTVRVSAAPARGSATVTVVAYYHGTPDSAALAFGTVSGAPTAASYGLPYSAKGWWPSPGSTLAKADSADITVEVPDPLVAVSNGVLLSRTPASPGWTRFRWHTRHAIYPDMISLAAAKYVEIRDSVEIDRHSVALTFFVFPDDSAKARSDFAIFPAMMRFFTSRVGPYPFADEKYGVAEFTVPSFREHQTIPSLGSQYFTGDHQYEWILAHELAHQWFGNSLSVRTWSDAWLNEGLATYAAWLWREHAHGRAAYDSAVADAMRRPFTGLLRVPDATDLDDMFTGTTFFKGALLVDGLRRGLGDSSFFQALQGYTHRFAFGLVAAGDLQRIMEEACGRSLTTFFGAWLRSSHPEAAAPPVCKSGD